MLACVTTQENSMGEGDKRSQRGKIIRATFGNSRRKKASKNNDVLN